ncbi:MAG: hypothetical protein ACO1RX_16640 [Candidatus Sericytochromatia bacterium]
MSSLGLSPALNRPTHAMLEALRRELGDELVSIYLVSPLENAATGFQRLLVILFDASLPVWEPLRPLCRQFWQQAQIQVEICAYTSLLEQLQANPLEQLYLQRHGHCLAGEAIFSDIDIASESLRQDLERTLHTLRGQLRRSLLQSDDQHLQALIPAVRQALLPVLEGLSLLRGLPANTSYPWLIKAYGLSHGAVLLEQPFATVLGELEAWDLLLQELQDKLSWMSESGERSGSSLLSL